MQQRKIYQRSPCRKETSLGQGYKARQKSKDPKTKSLQLNQNQNQNQIPKMYKSSTLSSQEYLSSLSRLWKSVL
ncbi:hypothetical protein ACN38_g6499 [Penicillium nordicum]|uniref:Uncharacterized protein n=1 Tax=Penicillium nordicum TaxID=229535 RepID=A0A0M8NZS1_9EURO|nr:hypothetical protein ACN38_g6499 [Penicillium nordicum]